MAERLKLSWHRVLARWKVFVSIPIVAGILWIIEGFVQDYVVEYLPKILIPLWESLLPSRIFWGVVGLTVGAVGVVLIKGFIDTRSQRLSDILEQLAQLRTEGVALRNKNILAENIAELHIIEMDAWDKKVTKMLRELSPVEAEMYRTLDWVTFPEVSGSWNPRHGIFLRMHSQRLQILQEIVERYMK